jgi:hypothetical protein
MDSELSCGMRQAMQVKMQLGGCDSCKFDTG